MNIPQLSATLPKLIAKSWADAFQLCQLQGDDAGELFAVVDANRAYLRQWLPWVDCTRSSADSRVFIEQVEQSLAHSIGLVLAICERRVSGVRLDQSPESLSDKAISARRSTAKGIVGVISLEPIDWPSRTGYVGYWLAQEHGGRGVMTMACRAMIDHAFSVLDLNRIVIACATENHRSRAIPERLGFKYDGRIRQAEQLYDRLVDHEVYVLVRDR